MTFLLLLLLLPLAPMVPSTVQYLAVLLHLGYPPTGLYLILYFS